MGGCAGEHRRLRRGCRSSYMAGERSGAAAGGSVGGAVGGPQKKGTHRWGGGRGRRRRAAAETRAVGDGGVACAACERGRGGRRRGISSWAAHARCRPRPAHEGRRTHAPPVARVGRRGTAVGSSMGPWLPVEARLKMARYGFATESAFAETHGTLFSVEWDVCACRGRCARWRPPPPWATATTADCPLAAFVPVEHNARGLQDVDYPAAVDLPGRQLSRARVSAPRLDLPTVRNAGATQRRLHPLRGQRRPR